MVQRNLSVSHFINMTLWGKMSHSTLIMPVRDVGEMGLFFWKRDLLGGGHTNPARSSSSATHLLSCIKKVASGQNCLCARKSYPTSFGDPNLMPQPLCCCLSPVRKAIRGSLRSEASYQAIHAGLATTTDHRIWTSPFLPAGR